MSNPTTTNTTGVRNSVYSGSEPFFAFFSQAQVALQTLRLSIDGRIVAPTSDLATQMENTRRVFQHNGKFPETIQDVLRIANQLQTRVQTWDREVQNIERLKQSKSGTQLQQLRSEIASVRMKSQMTVRMLSKLEIVLHQLEADEEKRLASDTVSPIATDESPPISEETDSVIIQVGEAIHDLVGRGLAIDFAAVGESTLGNDVQEIVWDKPLLMVVAQRTLHGTQVEEKRRQLHQPSESRLSLWIIPKFLDIANRMDAIAPNLRLEWVGPMRREPIAWHPLSLSVDNGPISPSIRQLIEKLVAKRFDKDWTKLTAICASASMDRRGDQEVNQIECQATAQESLR